MPEQFQYAIERFTPVNLQEINAVKLMNRIDTKFVMSERQLLRVLRFVRDDYRVLDIDGVRLNRYRSLYYDTPDFLLYMMHHNDRQNRHKVRCREYVDSGVTFLEIKHKTPQRRTVKRRIPVGGMLDELEGEEREFVEQHYPGDVGQLEAKITNSFIRITLVSRTGIERVTLDLDVSSQWHGVRHDMPGVAIAEIKQEKLNVNSPFFAQLRAMHVLPMGFSKYCEGMAHIYPQLKQNRFKPRTYYLNRLFH